jgi:prepilin-type N-terminal cleavage/methylation domain-containing protein
MAATRRSRGPGRRPCRRRVLLRRAPDRARAREDAGFTLIETILALVLLALVLSSMAGLLLGGMRNAAGLQRRQAAVTLAAQALEAARALTVVADQNSCVKLLQGRDQTSADQQWDIAPAGFTAVTDEAWTSNLCTGPVLLPLQGLPGAAGTSTDPAVVNGLSYTVRNFVGRCSLNAARAACVTSAAAPANAATLYRVLSLVTWSGIGCSGTCQYSASTLLDPSADPLFNVRGATAPVAVPDTICLAGGAPGTIDIVANDTGSLGPSPVTVVSAPSKGTLAASISSGVGGYRPNAGATGTDTFTYYLSDVNGLVSSTVTVQVQLGGC